MQLGEQLPRYGTSSGFRKIKRTIKKEHTRALRRAAKKSDETIRTNRYNGWSD